VKEITEAMFGGTVDVESRVGTGTTFTLALPIPPQRDTVRPVPVQEGG
jgi:signal transduction histidine kinase